MNRFVLIILLLLFAKLLFSQTASQPLELPNFIIEGKEQIDVQVGTKQIPSFSTYLDRSLMDSLIIVGKPRNYIIFPITFPNNFIFKNFPNAYIIGNFGSFLSTGISAGYKFSYLGYEVFPYANFNFSNGHIDNANYTKFSIGVQTDYLAPDKFYIFGGSKTTTNVGLGFKNYKLYALSDAPSRTQLDFDAKITSIGNFEGFDFETGASLNFANQTGAGNSLGENTISGLLEIKNRELPNQLGGRISLDFRSFDGSAANFLEFYGFAKFEVENLRIEPTLGFQMAKASNGKSRPMILISAVAQSLLSPDISIFAKLSNRLSNIAFRDFLKQNPYLADSILLDYGNKSEVETKIKYQAKKDFSLVFGANFSLNKRLPVFNFANFGFFDIQYIDATIFSLFLEGFWENKTIGTISGLLSINSSSESNNKKDVPNLPNYRFRTDYSKILFEKIKFGAFFELVGKRFADVENKFKLSDYNNLGFIVDYFLNPSTIISVNVENLLNSNIVCWYGYKEWGFNFKVGITYKF